MDFLAPRTCRGYRETTSERAARGPFLGRKNHYGSRSLRGTEVAGTFYSLVESAKLNGLEPRLYLRLAVRAGLHHETVPPAT